MCSRLFNNAKHSDVKIHIGKAELSAHSLVLVVGSKYFDTALRSGLQEGETKIFNFNEGHEHAHWRVFHYLYTGNYSDEADQHLKVEGR